VTLATPPFVNILGVMSGLYLGTLVPNLKSVALIVFELLALTPKNLGGHVTLAMHAPFWKNFWESRPDCPWEHFCQITSP